VKILFRKSLKGENFNNLLFLLKEWGRKGKEMKGPLRQTNLSSMDIDKLVLA